MRLRPRGPARRLAFLLLAVTVGAPALGQPPGATLRDRIVAVVDGDPLLDSDVDRAVALGSVERAPGETERALRRRVLDGLIEERLRFHEVARYGFEQVPVEMIAKQVEVIRGRFPSDEAFQQRLRQLGMPLEALEQLVAQQLQVLVYVDELLGARVFVGLEEIEAYYQRRLAPQLRTASQPVPPLDEVREQIREVLRQQRLNEELQRWTTELRRGADVEDYFDRPQRPLPPKVGEKSAAPPRAQSALPPPTRPPPLGSPPPLTPQPTASLSLGHQEDLALAASRHRGSLPPAPRGAGGATALPRSFEQ